MKDDLGFGDQKTLLKKLTAAWLQLRYVPKTASLVWAASRGWTVFWGVLLVLMGLLPVATVLLTRWVVDGALIAIENEGSWESVRALMAPAIGIAGTLVLMEMVSGLATWIKERQAALIGDHIASLIHDTSTSVDLSFYETPQYFDHLHRAKTEATLRPQILVANAGAMFQSLITLLAMAAVLFSFSPWVPLILFASTVPALCAVLKYAVKQHRWRRLNTEDERRSWYYDWELTARETAAELRLFNLGDHFKNKFKSVRTKLRKERLQIVKDHSLAEVGASLFALIAAAACVAWMGYRTFKGLLTLGELALFYAAFRQGQQMMRGLLGSVGDIYKNILFLGDLFEFLSLKPTITNTSNARKAPEYLDNNIEFKDVTFSYPGSDKKILDGFNMAIEANQITAIVGANGAGKSTLLRLLCRLYDPQGGSLTLDGHNLKSFELSTLRRTFTVMFQEPVQYNSSAEGNITLGDLRSQRNFKDAAKAAGAHDMIVQLPKQYDTILGRWFDKGTELSVGEWQRIALARAFLRQAPIVLLDEPTNSMDSWSETSWLKKLRKLVQGRTAIIITHRFTTAMKADIIHVMEKGKIVETGSHEELLKKGGRYFESWSAQMKPN